MAYGDPPNYLPSHTTKMNITIYPGMREKLLKYIIN
jgi:hypothetical protein